MEDLRQSAAEPDRDIAAVAAGCGLALSSRIAGHVDCTDTGCNRVSMCVFAAPRLSASTARPVMACVLCGRSARCSCEHATVRAGSDVPAPPGGGQRRRDHSHAHPLAHHEEKSPGVADSVAGGARDLTVAPRSMASYVACSSDR